MIDDVFIWRRMTLTTCPATRSWPWLGSAPRDNNRMHRIEDILILLISDGKRVKIFKRNRNGSFQECLSPLASWPSSYLVSERASYLPRTFKAWKTSSLSSWNDHCEILSLMDGASYWAALSLEFFQIARCIERERSRWQAPQKQRQQQHNTYDISDDSCYTQ